jgi:hypothetical protein
MGGEGTEKILSPFHPDAPPFQFGRLTRPAVLAVGGGIEGHAEKAVLVEDSRHLGINRLLFDVLQTALENKDRWRRTDSRFSDQAEAQAIGQPPYMLNLRNGRLRPDCARQQGEADDDRKHAIYHKGVFATPSSTLRGGGITRNNVAGQSPKGDHITLSVGFYRALDIEGKGFGIIQTNPDQVAPGGEAIESPALPLHGMAQ